MQFPERAVALAWVDRTLVDRDGQAIGACTAVFSDDATQVTEWVCADVEGRAVFIPALGAVESNGDVRVAVSRDGVATAPPVGGTDHISDEEEAALYRHYGIPHSREASPSLLPTTDDSRPDSLADSQPDSLAANGSRPDSPAADSAPVVAEDAAAGADSDWQAWPDESAAAEAPAGRRRAVSVAGGLAAVGVAVGAVLGARKLRNRRPPTRKERLAARGRAASAAVSARTARVAAAAAPVLASAAPVLESTKRAVGGRKRAGAVAGGVPTAALLFAALRRRRAAAADRTTD